VTTHTPYSQFSDLNSQPLQSLVPPLELPTITFAKEYEIKDPAGDLHLAFHGKAHTAGDIAVYCPQKKVVASGDVVIGFLPNLGDGYPRPWGFPLCAAQLPW